MRKAFQRSLTKQGFKFKLGIKVLSAKSDGSKVTLETETVKDGKKETMEADVVLVSAGPPPPPPSFFLGPPLGSVSDLFLTM